MVHNTSYQQNDHNIDMQNGNDKKIFSLPFCENDVLQLQELFVACGIHMITTKNIVDGRKIMQTILHSLNYFHNIGCITQEPGLPNFVCDIIKHIELEKNTKNGYDDLETFLTIYPCFDFIWVELSQLMLKKYSLQSITQIFEMYHVQERMPVIIMTYE